MRIIESLRNRANEPQGYLYILKAGMPLVAGMASATVMQFTDRLFLSRYSVDAIAASMPASIASMTLVMTLMGVCGYTSVIIAQYVGAEAPHRVGSALWQGLWCALAGTVLLCLTWWPAEWLFSLAGHTESVQVQEVTYFRVLNLGAGFLLVSAAFAGFFSGRGRTRPVMIANITAAVVNIPLDYVLIFGGLGVPPLGILGAGIATVIGWALSAVMLGCVVFTPKNDRNYHVLRGLCLEWGMLRRLLRFGLPSGINMFMEMIAVAWFIFEVGQFGIEALAASNIAFSINSLVFVPMLGLNIALAALVGQAMGRGRPDEAERVTMNTLHLAFAYMAPMAAFLALAAGPLMDVFAPSDLSPESFAPVRQQGVLLLYFIAVYSLVDAGNIVYFAALKGAGDTLGIMYLLLGGLVVSLILPIMVLKHLALASTLTYWFVFTAYVIFLALAVVWRFYQRGWRHIKVVETGDVQGSEL